MSAATNKLAYLLDTITYKPGWELQARDFEDTPGYIRTNLVITFEAPDPVTGKVNKIGHSKMVPSELLWDGMEQSILQFVKHMIIYMEMHEISEFLRVDGVPLTDPHPKKAASE